MKRFVLVVASAIALVPLAAPAAAGGGGCHGNYVPDARGVTVELDDICFDPLVVRIDTGQTVQWKNTDPVPHNIVGAAMAWSVDGDLSTGESVSFRFNEAGTFPYSCTLHWGMVGAVVVGNGVSTAERGERPSVTQLANAPVTPAKTSAPAEPASAADPASEPAESSSQAAAAAPAVAPPSAKPEVRAIDTTAASSRSNEFGDIALAVFALSGAIVLAGLAVAARRAPRTRELVG